MSADSPADPAVIGLAQRCLAAGYFPMPILRPDAPVTVTRRAGGEEEVVRQPHGKQPHGLLWPRKEKEVYGTTPAKVARWARLPDIADHPNVGVACGTVADVDIDVREHEWSSSMPWRACAGPTVSGLTTKSFDAPPPTVASRDTGAVGTGRCGPGTCRGSPRSSPSAPARREPVP